MATAVQSLQAPGLGVANLYDAVAETPNVTTSDLVVTVPCWFTDTQRQQLLEACEIANLNCHGLINDTTAVALNYGIWKNARGAFKDEENYYVMFLNFGATQYSVQIVKFSEGKMTVKSTTHDRFLGGRVIDMAIADKLVAGFKEQTKGLDASRTANPKAYIKLLIQAEKAKKNLCGGIPAIKVNCECLMEDRDLSNFLLKKEDLEALLDLYSEDWQDYHGARKDSLKNRFEQAKDKGDYKTNARDLDIDISIDTNSDISINIK